MQLTTVPLAHLTIDDEASYRHIALVQDLKQILLDAGFVFRVPAEGARGGWGRVLFLNLTLWSTTAPTDVLLDRHIAADEVAHTAWHHLARRACADLPTSVDAVFLGESIASAFDLYLVGRLLGNVPDAAFLETQIPAMAEVALDAGMSEADFEAMLQTVSADPERAFEDLRALLFDVGTSLAAVTSVEAAAATLARFDTHRFAPLLHHFELSNWIICARAYATEGLAPDPRVRAIDAALRAAPASIDWLVTHWVQPALRAQQHGPATPPE